MRTHRQNGRTQTSNDGRYHVPPPDSSDATVEALSSRKSSLGNPDLHPATFPQTRRLLDLFRPVAVIFIHPQLVDLFRRGHAGDAHPGDDGVAMTGSHGAHAVDVIVIGRKAHQRAGFGLDDQIERGKNNSPPEKSSLMK